VVVCLLLLGAAAILAGPVASRLQFKHAKRALPLKAPLATLDEGSLAPYRVVRRQTLEPMVVEALDTEAYLSWVLEDMSVAESDPLRHAQLFVTYYTGGHHLVPHTPDVCFIGSGYEPAQRHENQELRFTRDWSGSGLIPAERDSTIPIRVCTFKRTRLFGNRKRSVVYTFNCNGEFVATRNAVRLLVNSPGNTYAYFSKVEASFPGASRAESVDGARKLFERVLPVLMKDHWPDFAEAESRLVSSD
jgi:hypothetical protein